MSFSNAVRKTTVFKYAIEKHFESNLTSYIIKTYYYFFGFIYISTPINSDDKQIHSISNVVIVITVCIKTY